LSSNSLELAFTTPKNIFTFSPPAVKQNRTSKISVYTFFSTDTFYGSPQYFCEYGYNSTGNFTNAIIQSNGVFQCEVILLTEGKAFMKIWMTLKNLIKLITFNSELFNVVNSNFFEPSYATPIGGDKIQILDYSDVISEIKFTNPVLANKYSFNCSINGTTLTCVVPKISISDIPLYSTEDIQFSNNQSISTRFILYEKRNIAYFHPKVVSSTEGTFFINITLNNVTTMAEGKLFLVLAKFTDKDVRYDLGTSTNLTKISQSVATLQTGVYPMELFYFNPFSFEIRSMFSISNPVQLTFTGSSSFQLLSNQDMFYVNKNESITVKFTNIDALKLDIIQKQSIRCKLGSEILETKVLSNDEFQCSLNSHIPKEMSVFMVYKNEDAYNQEILLSSNTIKITFIGNLLNLLISR
jgi:hypothetical protein